jgi:hypothetical protein
MAITTATLGGVTLPHVQPDGYIERPGYRGADRVMLSGALATDLLTTTVKRTFELTWRRLTEAQVTTLLSAFATVRDGSAAFVSPLGGSYTVTRDEGFYALDIRWRADRLVARAEVTMRLREV